MSEEFRGKVVVITGASSGIGEHVALLLAEEGAKVVLAARRADELERVAAACRDRGGEATSVPTDVAEQGQCEALIAGAVNAYGRVDALVNNAGLGMWGRIDEIRDLSIFEKLMRVNYLSAVWCTIAALPHLKESRGRIVAVCSLAGLTGVPLRGGYSAAKHAMAGFFDTLRIELRETGVSVTQIYPGFVATGTQAKNLGPDGQPLGKMPAQVVGAMSSEECARHVVVAMRGRARSWVHPGRPRLLLALRPFFPSLIDNLTARVMRRKPD